MSPIADEAHLLPASAGQAFLLAQQAGEMPLGAPLLLDPRWVSTPLGGLAQMMFDRSARLEPPTPQSAVFGGPDSDGRLFDFGGGIAYIPIRGPLMNDGFIDRRHGWSGYKGIGAQFAAALADQEVRAMLFDIRSPGGTSSGVFDLVDQIHAGRGQGKIIWAVANDLATSAAYAIASAAERIFMPRLGAVGSIGAWAMHVNLKGMYDQLGWEVTLVKAGEKKTDGHPFDALPERVRADWQARLDYARAVFVATVARNRGLGESALLETEGASFDERDAIALGLVDGIAPDRDVVRALLEELSAATAA